jgi:hypothetical protein
MKNQKQSELLAAIDPSLRIRKRKLFFSQVRSPHFPGINMEVDPTKVKSILVTRDPQTQKLTIDLK